MTGISYDLLWKSVVTELFEEFLLFFAPDLYEQVDFTKQPDFLEQELMQLFPDSEDGKRYTDKLAKVYLKNGDEQWILVHVEIQGSRDEDFAQWMFRYFYRVFDKYNRNIYAIALFTDDSKTFQPNEYRYDFYGTQLRYKYHTYKIQEQDEAFLKASENPFALAVLAGLYVIRGKKQAAQKFSFKRTLFELLLEKQWDRKTMNELLIFIDTMIKLPDGENKRFIEMYIPIIEKERERMGLSIEHTSFAQYFKEVGREEGRKEGRKEGREEGRKEGLAEGMEKALKDSVQKMYAKNLSHEQIASLLEIPLNQVEQWIRE